MDAPVTALWPDSAQESARLARERTALRVGRRRASQLAGGVAYGVLEVAGDAEATVAAYLAEQRHGHRVAGPGDDPSRPTPQPTAAEQLRARREVAEVLCLRAQLAHADAAEAVAEFGVPRVSLGSDHPQARTCRLLAGTPPGRQHVVEDYDRVPGSLPMTGAATITAPPRTVPPAVPDGSGRSMWARPGGRN